MPASKNASTDRPAALVTGGAVRVGRALVLGLARQGHDVVIHYHSSAQPAAETLKAAADCGVEALTLQADLTDVTTIPALMKRARERFPHLGLLVNSASTYQHASIMESDPALFDQQFAANLRAPFFLTQAFARHCRQGHVVNMLDNKMHFNQFQYAAYLLSKKGLAEFTRMASMELAPAIRVNGIAPGVILPAQNRNRTYLAWRTEGIPLKRQGDTDHLVQALLYLQENRFVTGQLLVVDGGESIQHVGRNYHAYESE